MNFQDVIRDVHDPVAHALQTTASLSASTVYIGTPTLYAVVNTGSATDPNIFIGLTTTVIGSAPTIFAVVNTSAAGQSSVVVDRGHNFIGLVTVVQSDSSRSIVGNLTLTDSKSYIGLTTTTLGVSDRFVGLVTVVQSSAVRSLVGNVTLSGPIPAGTNQIGSVTIPHVVSTTFSGNITLDAGSRVGVLGNITLSDAKTFIGLTTTVMGNTPTVFLGTPTLFAVVNTQTSVGITGNLTLTDSKGFIGLTTTTLGASPAFIGIVTLANRDISGNVTLSDSKTYVGLTTTTLGIGTQFVGLVTVVQSSSVRSLAGNLTLTDSKAYIGLVTSTIGIGTTFIGLVTAWALNAGTTKTLVSLPVGLGNNSLATVVVPTNANKIKVTNFLLNSNVTTEIAIKSGVTYLTGNASLGVTLFPGGGFELPGSPDSPSWIGLPSGALIIEKRDPGGTVSKVAGGIIYFDEA